MKKKKINAVETSRKERQTHAWRKSDETGRWMKPHPGLLPLCRLILAIRSKEEVK